MAQNETEFATPPEQTDFHGKKRELLKQGVEKGFLNWSQIKKDLAYTWGQAEIDVFLFTCDQMGIEVKGKPEE